MKQRIGKYLWILPLVFILALSYWRFTYIINPNLEGKPVLLNYRFYIDSLGANSLVNIRSIIIYWILFLIGNVTLFYFLFRSRQKVQAILIFFLVISLFSGGLLLVDRLLFPSKAFFNMGALMKNFLLGPLFTALSYIMIEYFHWFTKK
jgi:hypothetical protein